MNRRIALTTILVLAFALAFEPGVAQDNNVSAIAKGKPKKPPITNEIHTKLDMVLERLDYPEVEFADVIQDLRDKTGVNIHPKWNMLLHAGVDQRTSVNVNLSNVTFEKGLEVVLEDVGGVGVPLGHVVSGGVITISTKDDLGNRTKTRVYDVADLIDWTNRDRELVGDLFALIYESVGSDSWKPDGIGAMRHLEGNLAITQTVENHRAIEELLDQLRAKKSQRPPTPHVRAREAAVKIKLVGNMKETCFDPSAMGVIAVAGLRDEVLREPADIIEELENLLAQTKTTGLRNAIRLTLKDLYKAQGENEKVLQHLREMLQENDQAAQQQR